MAIPLVQFHDDGSCQTCPEAMEWLRTIHDPVAVVAVAGRYRTGKSFLLNHVLLRAHENNDQETGFPVGPTTQPCTKGLWLCRARPARATMDPMDARVTCWSSIQRAREPPIPTTRDTRIFALALLLSSYFIYNSQGSIDEPALANLQVVTEVSRMVRVQAAEETSMPRAPWNAPSSEDSEDAGEELSRFLSHLHVGGAGLRSGDAGRTAPPCKRANI